MTSPLTMVRLRVQDFLDTLKHDGIVAAIGRLGGSRGVGRGTGFSLLAWLGRLPSGMSVPGGLPPVIIASLSLVIVIGGIVGLLGITAGSDRPIPAPVVHLDIPFPGPMVRDVSPPEMDPGSGTVQTTSTSPDIPHTETNTDADTVTAPPQRPRPPAGLTPGGPTFTPGTEFALPRAPDPALVEKSDSGPLPVIAPDGREAWRVYARPFSDPYQRPRIGILIAGLGMSQSATLTAVQQLSGAVTLGFNPYARKLQDWIDQARAAGHEVMLELPMEPVNYPDDDPGPHTLLTNLDAAANLERTEWLLSRFAGYVGVTNYMGSKFTTSPEALRPVLNTLQRRGLMFLDTRSSVHSVAGQVANEIGLVQAVNNRFLDNKASRSAIDARLAELERIARATGSAIGIAFPYPVSIERIAAWAETLENRGLVLAPISNLAKRGVMSGPVENAEGEGETPSHHE
ncbi:MAG: divergent polysaccharide deacetylase family protein [Rhodospirillales bacterium]|nr:divergent polysaccharide deacetylase family protein [Rhodospirillales bacterium]